MEALLIFIGALLGIFLTWLLLGGWRSNSIGLNLLVSLVGASAAMLFLPACLCIGAWERVFGQFVMSMAFGLSWLVIFLFLRKIFKK